MRQRAVGSLVAAAVVGVLAVPTLGAMAGDGGSDAEAPQELPLADLVSALQSTTTSTTSTTILESDGFDEWFAGLDPEEQAAFLFMTLDEDEREAWLAAVEPDPEPAPAPPPPPEQPAADPTPPPAPAPAPAPPPESPPAPPVADGSHWDRLAQCEATGNWHINTGNGFHGGLQFHPGTWNAYGGQEFAPQADQASREQQIAVAERVLAAAGGSFTDWPGCRAKLGLP